MNKHKHHIIPRYRCKELGIDPDFDENIVEVTREDHALIHWGYKCDDLEPLFEHITPAQWIIDLIPREDNRDAGAAVINARGEIDKIEPLFGENHPLWGKRGKKLSLETKKKMSESHSGKKHTLETKKKISKSHFGIKPSLETKKKMSESASARKHTLETKKKISEVTSGKNNPRYTHGKCVGATKNPKIKASYQKEWYTKKKAERQGKGTLEGFLG